MKKILKLIGIWILILSTYAVILYFAEIFIAIVGGLIIVSALICGAIMLSKSIWKWLK